MPTHPENSTSPTPPTPIRSLNKYTVAKVVVAAGLLSWLLQSGRLDLGILLSTPLSILHVLGMSALFVGMVLQAWRWWWLIKAQQIDLSFPSTLGLVWIGRFLALVLPGVVGGDVVRGYYVIREAPSAKMAGVSTILLDRAMGFYSSFLLGMFALAWVGWSREPLTGPVRYVGAVSILCVVGASLVFLALWLDPMRDRILGFVPERFRAPVEAVLKAYRTRGRTLLICLALSLAIGVTSMAAFVVAGHVLDTPIGWKQAFMVCPLVFVATALPLSPNGVGVGEAAASVLFAQFGVETGATVMLVVRLWLLVLRLPGGLLYIFRRGHPTALNE